MHRLNKTVLFAGLLATALSAPVLAHDTPRGGEHGFGLSQGCEGPLCEFDELNCEMTFSYNDDFGDSTQINEAYALVFTADGEVRLPAAGDLEIIAVSGNTTATVGGALPVLIGPGGSTLNGLPGDPDPGAVEFGVTGYTIQDDDPSPLATQGLVIWEDRCDDPNTPPDCPSGQEFLASVGAFVTVFHPRIAVEKTADVVEICTGVPTDVTYTYTVTNPGNVALGVELTDDAPCEAPKFIGGDTNGNDLLDTTETWTYECMATISGETSNTAVVTGETANPGCDAVGMDTLTITTTRCPGACCFENGACEQLTEDECADAGGLFQGIDVPCNPCTPGDGACCFDDGSCEVLSRDDCLAFGGDFRGGGSKCGPGVCSEQKGACCRTDGTCAARTEFECNFEGGEYLGDDTICVPGLCVSPDGACCFEDGSCVVASQDNCHDAGGSYQGEGTMCVPDLCPQPEGACCFDSGACVSLTRDDCNNQGGIYRGDDVPCTPELCPQPKGACCIGDGICVAETEEDCMADGGSYRGDETICEPGLCDLPKGACCFPDGFCIVLTQAVCEDAGGSYQGSGSVCAPGLCPQPVSDVNGDGRTDAADVLALLQAWGTCLACPEDVNADGVVNFVDLLEVLAAW